MHDTALTNQYATFGRGRITSGSVRTLKILGEQHRRKTVALPPSGFQCSLCMVLTNTRHTENKQIHRFAVTDSQSHIHLIIHFSRKLFVDSFILLVAYGVRLLVEIAFTVPI